MSYEDVGRDWNDASTNQGMPKITRNDQKLERGKKGFFPTAFSHLDPADTLISDF